MFVFFSLNLLGNKERFFFLIVFNEGNELLILILQKSQFKNYSNLTRHINKLKWKYLNEMRIEHEKFSFMCVVTTFSEIFFKYIVIEYNRYT